MTLTCPGCHKVLRLRQPYPYHAGFGEEGFLYCDRDATVLTFSEFDRGFQRIIPNKVPWGLTPEDRSRVEQSLKSCPCGGRFLFKNSAKCPHCGTVLRRGITKDIYYIVLGKSLKASRNKLWKSLASSGSTIQKRSDSR